MVAAFACGWHSPPLRLSIPALLQVPPRILPYCPHVTAWLLQKLPSNQRFVRQAHPGTLLGFDGLGCEAGYTTSCLPARLRAFVQVLPPRSPPTAQLSPRPPALQLCCAKCPKGYKPGANVRTCILSFLSAAQPFTSQRRCALRPYAPPTLQLAPQPRPQASASCPAGSILFTTSGVATCKACSGGGAYWAERGRRGAVVRAVCCVLVLPLCTRPGPRSAAASRGGTSLEAQPALTLARFIPPCRSGASAAVWLTAPAGTASALPTAGELRLKGNGNLEV